MLLQSAYTCVMQRIHCLCPVYYYVHKWKNHFIEMKGDVGMSVHEKGGKQVNATPTHKTIYNPIPTFFPTLQVSPPRIVWCASLRSEEVVTGKSA